MAKYLARSFGIWLNILISVVVLCSVTAGENTPPNPTSLESGLKTQDSGRKTPSPDIFFPETTHAFGKVFVGDKVEHIFKVVNRGNAPLHISEVSVGCDCTVAKLEKWLLAPNEEEEIKIIFSPDENTNVGKTAKFVYVNSDDPDAPRYKLKFTANVRKDVVYAPQGFEFGFVPKGSVDPKRIVFASKLNPADFSITKVTTFSPTIEVSSGKLNDNGEWYVDASIKEDAKIGKLAGNIAVFTNSIKQPEIKIATNAEVVREVTVVPDKICFGKIERGKEGVRSLTIFHAKGIKVEKVEPSLSWVSADVTPADNSNNISTEVKLKLLSANAPKGKSEGVLSIYTNSKKFPVLKVHLCGNVLESQI